MQSVGWLLISVVHVNVSSRHNHALRRDCNGPVLYILPTCRVKEKRRHHRICTDNLLMPMFSR